MKIPNSLTSCLYLVREKVKELTLDFNKSEDDLKSLQSGVGQVCYACKVKSISS